MNRIFQPRGFFTVPDGTDVSPFLNATDVTQVDLPWGALGDVSIAAGRIGPKVQSWIHVHPVVTQVIWLTNGALTLRLKESSAIEPYDLQLRPGQAAVLEAGTFFQLRNDGDAPADVLYIVSPTYIFELDDERVKYDDAILVAKTWEALAASSYGVQTSEASLYDVRARRDESKRRLALRKGSRPKPLSEDRVHSLKANYDYLAPDGSEIRVLVSGEHGSFAHCVLPAGNTSAPVRHRTVEELWYVLEGAGEVWRMRECELPRVDSVRAGDSIRIPVGTSFQFRAQAGVDLKLLLATMPPWPGAHEAVAESTEVGGWGAK